MTSDGAGTENCIITVSEIMGKKRMPYLEMRFHFIRIKDLKQMWFVPVCERGWKGYFRMYSTTN